MHYIWDDSVEARCLGLQNNDAGSRVAICMNLFCVLWRSIMPPHLVPTLIAPPFCRVYLNFARKLCIFARYNPNPLHPRHGQNCEILTISERASNLSTLCKTLHFIDRFTLAGDKNIK